MTIPWSYGGDPAGSPADLVRLLLGDTDAAAPLCADAEVSFALQAQGPNPYLAAAWLAERVSARLSRDEGVSFSGVSLSPQRSAEKMRELAARLRAEAAAWVNPAHGMTFQPGAVALVYGAGAGVPAPSFVREDPAQDAQRGWL